MRPNTVLLVRAFPLLLNTCCFTSTPPPTHTHLFGTLVPWRASQAWVEAHRWPRVMRWTAANKPFIFARRPGFETHLLLLLPPAGGDSSGGGDGTGGSNAALLAALSAAASTKTADQGLFLFAEAAEGDGGDDGNGGGQGEVGALAASLGAGALPTAVAVRSDAKAGKVTFFRRTDPDGVRDDDEVNRRGAHEGSACISIKTRCTFVPPASNCPSGCCCGRPMQL